MKGTVKKTPTEAPGFDVTSYTTEGLLILTAVIWGCNFAVVKAALRSLEPHVFNALRFTLSVGLIACFWMAQTSERRRRAVTLLRDRWKSDRSLLLLVVALGLFGHVFYQVLFIEGIARTNAGTTSLLLAGVPLWTAVVGQVLGIDHVNRAAWFGLGIGFLGTALVAGAGFDPSRGLLSFDLGALLVMLASIAWAGYTVFSKPLMRTLSPMSLTLGSMLVGLPVLWLIALPALPSADLSAVGMWTWVGVVYSGGLSTGLAYVLWNLAIRQRGPSHTAVYGNLVPVVGVATGAAFLGETVGLPELAGGALILAGLVWMRRAR